MVQDAAPAALQPHPTIHLVLALALLVGAAVFMRLVRNRLIRRRLLFTAGAAVAAALAHGIAGLPLPNWALEHYDPVLRGLEPFEHLLLIAALTNALVALAFNPWFRDGESDRAPAIIQDSLVLAVIIFAGWKLFDFSGGSLLAGSAIVAAVAGFALQDTLGNAFAGIAIQIERPFNVGHWIGVGEHVGMVTEMTWRSTKIRTRSGNLVALPNSQMSSKAVLNYSTPNTMTRLDIELSASYDAPPNLVREALVDAARSADHVAASPAPDALLVDFGPSAINYRVRVWVDDFSKTERAMSAVRVRAYYEFKRRNIDIPFPTQIQVERRETPPDVAAMRERFVRELARVPVLAGLPPAAHQALASTARELLYADGEVIVREGDKGESMFLIATGCVSITVGADHREVAVTRAGGYFGEMSLLTGDPRTATVTARGDTTVIEITCEAFRDYVQKHPEVLEQLIAAATIRRKERDAIRAASGVPPPPPGASLRDRMLVFFGLA